MDLMNPAAVEAVAVDHLFDLAIDFEPMQVFPTPLGTRMVAVVRRGTATGPRLDGRVLAGGGDWLVIGSDGVARIDVTDEACLRPRRNGRRAAGGCRLHRRLGDELMVPAAVERTVGLLLPTREQAMAGVWDAARLLDIAARAETLGFDSVWTGDSLTARPRFAPLTLLAAVAARTSHIRVGTAALTAALRPPVLGAASVATLDRIAGGRLVLGLGAGFPDAATEAEFEVLGAPFHGRLERLGAVVDAWRAAWRGEIAPGFPTPSRSAGPPMWLAGAGPRALRLAAWSFDGWLPYVPDPETYRQTSHRLDDLLSDAGRTPADVARALYVTVLVDGAVDEMGEWCQGYYGVSADVLERFQAVVAGPLDACVDRLARFADSGACHLVLRIGSPHTERYLDTTAELARRWRRL